MWFGGSIQSIPPLAGVVDKITAHLQTLVNFNQVEFKDSSSVLSTLRTLERSLTIALRFAFGECGTNEGCLERKIEYYIEKELTPSQDAFIQNFMRFFREQKLARSLAQLISAYGGNSVWSIVLSSIIATILTTPSRYLARYQFKPSILV